MGDKKRKRETKEERRSRRSKQLLSVLERAIKEQEKEGRATYSRQVDYDDVFSSLYQSGKEILVPPYLPGKMYELYEESGILTACVEAYVTNIDGFGHEIVPVSKSSADLAETPEAAKEKEKLEQLFAEPNGEQSMTSLRELLRRDYEITGNAYIEVVRSMDGEPSLLFWADSKRTRLCPLGKDFVSVDVSVTREGSTVDIPTQRKFRRYVQLIETTQSPTTTSATMRYFKEYGDPRSMNALTGDYTELTEEQKERVATTGFIDEGQTKKFLEATEIIHLKFGNSTYGIPRWIGTILSVMGLNRAEYINFDLFDSQGIPPLLITIAGGELTESSFQDLVTLFKKAKGAENFHKLLLLEAESSAVDLNGKEILPKLEIQDLMEYRKEDAMFLNYTADSRKTVRQYGFRLPGLFVGETNDYNYATAKVARETAEEQVFVPERKSFDEVINRKIVRALDAQYYKFASKAPVIRSNEELLKVLPTLADKGALTVNGLIEFMNETFGTSLKLYDGETEEWANQPIPEALYAVSGGFLDDLLPPATGVDDVDNGMTEQTEKMYKAILKLEKIAQDAFKEVEHDYDPDERPEI